MSRALPSAAPPPPRRSALIALGALLLSGACKTPDWAMYNLRQTHQLDGSVRRVGKPFSPIEYAVIGGFRNLNINIGIEEELLEGSDEPIEDPLESSLEALVTLHDDKRPSAREAGLAVEAFTWLALEDDYVLARERAVLGLGRAALRLSLTDGPRALLPGASPAGPEEAAKAISALLRAANREELLGAVEGTGPGADPSGADAEVRAEMRDACEAAAALVLDRRGARRVLSVVNALLRVSLPVEDRKALEALSLDMQRRCVEQTLAAALDDPSGVVRAAALRAAVEAAENRLPGLLRGAFRDPDWRVGLEGMHLLQRHGLPRAAGDDAEVQASLRERWLIDLAQLTLHRDPRVGTGACKVLSLHAEAGFESLRPEDWAAWIRRRAEAAP